MRLIIPLMMEKDMKVRMLLWIPHIILTKRKQPDRQRPLLPRERGWFSSTGSFRLGMKLPIVLLIQK